MIIPQIQISACVPAPCRAELAALKAGAERTRRAALKQVPVVGATACALMQPWAASAGPFTFVVLDECSQMTEPLSLLPLLRAKARCVA